MTGCGAVTQLLWMRLRGNLRQRGRELLSLRGALSLTSIVVFVGLLVYSTAQVSADPTKDFLADHQGVLPALLPWGVLFAIVSTVLSGSGPALYFNRAEVNWLWSAPISRVWLVYYKLVGYATGAAMTSLLLAVLLPGELTTRIVRFLTLLLTLLFVQTMSTALSMSLAYLGQGNGLAQRHSGRLRTGLLFALIILVVAVVLVGEPALTQLVQFSNQSWVQYGLLPFSVIAELVLHDRPNRDLAIDALTVISMLGLLTALIVLLDKRLDQHMLEASARSNHRWSKALRSGNLLSRRFVVSASSHPPGRLGGFGPLVWSRWLYAVRSSGHSVVALSVTAGLAGLLSGTLIGTVQPTYLASAAFFASVYFLPRVLVFDFRGAPEQMELLRSLPVPAFIICLSQVMVPVFLKTIIELMAVSGLLLTAQTITIRNWLTILCVLPIINFLIIALDNGLFLLRPTRLLPVGRMDFDFLGRTLFEFLVKSIALAVIATGALGGAFWVSSLLGGGPFVFIGIVFGCLLLVCMLSVVVLALLFRAADITWFDRL